MVVRYFVCDIVFGIKIAEFKTCIVENKGRSAPLDRAPVIQSVWFKFLLTAFISTDLLMSVASVKYYGNT